MREVQLITETQGADRMWNTDQPPRVTHATPPLGPVILGDVVVCLTLEGHTFDRSGNVRVVFLKYIFVEHGKLSCLLIIFRYLNV